MGESFDEIVSDITQEWDTARQYVGSLPFRVIMTGALLSDRVGIAAPDWLFDCLEKGEFWSIWYARELVEEKIENARKLGLTIDYITQREDEIGD